MHAGTSTTERAARVKRALADILAGKMVILVDDEDRENEGDLVMAADKVPGGDKLHGALWSGLICLTLTEEWADHCSCRYKAHARGTAARDRVYVSIEARHGVTSGISAADRAHDLDGGGQNAKPEDW